MKNTYNKNPPTFDEACRKCSFGCRNCRFFDPNKIECTRPHIEYCRSRRLCPTCDPKKHDKFKPKK